MDRVLRGRNKTAPFEMEVCVCPRGCTVWLAGVLDVRGGESATSFLPVPIWGCVRKVRFIKGTWPLHRKKPAKQNRQGQQEKVVCCVMMERQF